jgi:hypothetical protein
MGHHGGTTAQGGLSKPPPTQALLAGVKPAKSTHTTSRRGFNFSGLLLCEPLRVPVTTTLVSDIQKVIDRTGDAAN